MENNLDQTIPLIIILNCVCSWVLGYKNALPFGGWGSIFLQTPSWKILNIYDSNLYGTHCDRLQFSYCSVSKYIWGSNPIWLFNMVLWWRDRLKILRTENICSRNLGVALWLHWYWKSGQDWALKISHLNFFSLVKNIKGPEMFLRWVKISCKDVGISHTKIFCQPVDSSFS